MAQSMLVSSIGGKEAALLQSQTHRLRPTPFSHLLLPRVPHGRQLPPPAASFFPTLAIFKPKTKAPAKKQVVSFALLFCGTTPCTSSRLTVCAALYR